MSKKQREKVEDEVRYHKEMNSQQAQRDAATGLNLNGGSGSIGSASTTGSGNGNHGSGSSPDSSVFDPPQPSSTEHMYGGGGFPYDSGKNIFLNYIYNLFVTSKHQFSNPPIHEFKVLQNVFEIKNKA